MPSTSNGQSDENAATKPRTYLLTSENAKTTFLGNLTWCPLSERRLLTKLAMYKPVGLRRKFNLFGLMHSLHYIVEDEEDVDFEEYLLPDNYKLYLERQQSPQKDIMVFPPKYRFRPNQEQILKKVTEFYNIDILSQYDSIGFVHDQASKEYGIPDTLPISSSSRK